MKYNSFILFFVLSFLIVSCTDNLVDVGTGIQPMSDGITVGADTFHVVTQNVDVASMYSKADSFLLGSFYDAKYGTTQADILAQVEGPIGFKYPQGAVVDSTMLVMTCYSYFGDKYAPLDVNVYEMNKGTFKYTSNYATNLNPADYVDFSNSDMWLGHNVVTARYPDGVKSDSLYKIIKLSDQFSKRFFNDTKYSSEQVFSQFFGGVYVTPKFGTSSLLTIRSIGLENSYHYRTVRDGKDTIITGVVQFPANMSVRQVNRILHPDKAAVMAKLQQKDSVNFVSAPANIQTDVVVPSAEMKRRMDAKIINKKLTINNVLLKVEVTELDSSVYAQPRVVSLLVIKDSELNDFFTKDQLPTGSNAVLGSYVGATTSTAPYYSFNIAKLIATEIKTAATKGTALPESLTLRLVPVDVTYNSSRIMTAVKQQNSMSAITIRSGKNVKSPMRIHVVYSGF